MSEKKDKQERPVVSVEAQTANTTGIQIIAENGTAWLVATHNCITIKSDGLKVEVRP